MDQHNRTAWPSRAGCDDPHPIDTHLDALDAAAYPPPLDQFETLVRHAVREMDPHIDQDGLCAVEGSAWPCARALLAEHNLELARPHGGAR
jgi:hypothetical protein